MRVLEVQTAVEPGATWRPASRWLELGLGLVVVAVPLAFLPSAYSPFVDPKLMLLLAGTMCVWAGHRGGSPLAAPAAVWVAAVAVAGALGVDWWWSLAGPERTGNGLLLLGSSAFLLVAGTRVPASLRERIPTWLVATSLGVAAVGLLYRVWPGAVDLVVPNLSFEGGTLGHQVFLAGLMASGIVAAVGLTRMRALPLATILVVLTTALALSTKRVGWIALAVGLAVALWRARPPRPRALIIVVVVAGTLAGWTVADAFLGPAVPLSGARRFGELSTDSARARVTALPPLVRGWAKRPVLGWGPGNVWGAYVSSATEPEMRRAGRGIGDAHNILLEAAVTTGVVGLAALLALMGLTVREMRKGGPSVGWAAGGAAALALYHLLQPNNVFLTPLLFLLAGMACSPGPEPVSNGPAEGFRRHGWTGRAGRAAAGILLAGGLAVSAAVVVASVLEQYGRTYASERALRTSVAITPGRVSAAEALSLYLALDGRIGDQEAGREAARLAGGTVRRHPWNPGVRLVAADVHLLLRDPEAALAWVDRHKAVFPEDPIPELPPDLVRSPQSEIAF